MNIQHSTPTTPLRARMVSDMTARNLGPASQTSHLRACKRFAAWLGRSPETATPDDVKDFQQHLVESGTSICTRNQTMTGVKFLFRVTLRRHDLVAEIFHLREPDRVPLVLRPGEGGDCCPRQRRGQGPAPRGGGVMSDDDQTYEVGYGKPPVATQFKKGKSGNPRGRPKGARGVRTLLAEALAQQITISEAGRTSRVSKSEALILSLITRAIKGDIRAAAQILRLMEEQGEAPQREGGINVTVIDQFDDPE